MNETTENNIEDTEQTILQEEASLEIELVDETVLQEETSLENETIDETVLIEDIENIDNLESIEEQDILEEISLETISEIETSTDEITSMSMPFIGLTVLQCIISILLIVVVLKQSKSASSMTSSAITGGEVETYWSKNKGRSEESRMARLSVILAVIFFALTLILGFIK